MQNDAKTNYLYAFEDAFRQKCATAGINPARWKLGMWTSAHMSFGLGDSVEAGAGKWFAHVEAQEKRKKRKK